MITSGEDGAVRAMGYGLARCTREPLPLARLVSIDVDGTLIELEETPASVVVSDALKQLLTEVSRRLGGALALVSGRSIEVLDALFAPVVFPAAGLHGVERRLATGERRGQSYRDPALAGAQRASRCSLKRTPEPSSKTRAGPSPCTFVWHRNSRRARGKPWPQRPRPGARLSRAGRQDGARDQAFELHQGDRHRGIHAGGAVSSAHAGVRRR